MDSVIASAEHIVSALWVDSSQFPIVAAKLNADDMPDTEAGLIYRIMAEKGKTSLPVRGLVEAEALRRGVTKEYITRLNFRGRHETPQALEAYACEIANAAGGKRLEAFGAWLQEQAKKNEISTDELQAIALKKLTNSMATSNELRPLSEYVDEVEKDFDNWMAGIVEGRYAGFKTIDETFRLVDSELTVIAGRPGSGKTSLTWQIVVNVAEEMKRTGEEGVIAVFSADMSGRSLVKRSACTLAGVDSKLAKRNLISAEEQKRVRDAMNYLRTIPVWMDDSPSPSTENMHYRMLSLNAKHSVKMFMFDFAELGGDEGDNEENRISNIAKNLRNICKAMKVPGLIDSQLNRKCEERLDKIPAMSDLRGSGMLEQVADNIFLITRPEYYIKRGQPAKLIEATDDKDVAYVIQAKGRNDGMGFYRMEFIEKFSRFADLPETYRVQL